MEVYHASPVKVEKPDTLHSREFLDFGKGFYVTTLREQAINMLRDLSAKDKKPGLTCMN